METPMRYEISGVGVDSRVGLIHFLFAALTIPMGFGVLYFLYLIHFRSGKITIDTDDDLVSTRHWSVHLSQIDNIDGEQDWHYDRHTGHSTTVTITLLGDFGSRSVDFKSRQLAMEFLNFLRKARSGDYKPTRTKEESETSYESIEEIEEARAIEEKNTARRRILIVGAIVIAMFLGIISMISSE